MATFYHGTTASFDRFEDDFIGSNFGLEEVGHYFCLDKSEALEAVDVPAAGRVVEVSVEIDLFEVGALGEGDAVAWWDLQDQNYIKETAIRQGLYGISVTGDSCSFVIVFDAEDIEIV